jgi:hypothetical protein
VSIRLARPPATADPFRLLGSSLLLLLLLLPACKDRALQERADQIRQYSDQEDRIYTTQAIHQIEHQFWTLRDHIWMGKLPDGTLVRLDSPRAVAAPLPSRAFYSGWHLQLTVSSDDWRTDPPSEHSQPFQAVYAITRRGPTNWDIQVTTGPATTPLHREEILTLEAD